MGYIHRLLTFFRKKPKEISKEAVGEKTVLFVGAIRNMMIKSA